MQKKNKFKILLKWQKNKSSLMYILILQLKSALGVKEQS